MKHLQMIFRDAIAPEGESVVHPDDAHLDHDHPLPIRQCSIDGSNRSTTAGVSAGIREISIV